MPPLAASCAGQPSRPRRSSSTSNAPAVTRHSAVLGDMRPGAGVPTLLGRSSNSSSSMRRSRPNAYLASVASPTTTTTAPQAITTGPRRRPVRRATSHRPIPASARHSAVLGFMVTLPGSTLRNAGQCSAQPSSASAPTADTTAPARPPARRNQATSS
jgi:hypothetical protein